MKNLIERFAEEHELSMAAAKRLWTSTIDIIADAIAAGEEVALHGFGKFTVRSRRARTGRNPQTGAAIKIAASKNVGFKAAKAMKTRVANPKAKKPAAKKTAAKPAAKAKAKPAAASKTVKAKKPAAKSKGR